MRFTEIRSSMDSFSGASTPDYQLAFISSEVKNIINNLNEAFLEYLTKDITKTEISINLQDWLGGLYYRNSNEYAKECIEQCPSVDFIWGRKIKNWTDHALKCYDNFLLKYIQIDLNEEIPKSSNQLKETDVYNYWIEQGGIKQDIGQNFKNIYQIRSAFQHIQIEEKDGIRVPKKISNAQCNKWRDVIVLCFRKSIIDIISLSRPEIEKENI